MRLTGLTFKPKSGSRGTPDVVVNFTVLGTEGSVLFGYFFDEPAGGSHPERGRLFQLSDSEAFWLGEALIKAKGRT